MAGEQGNGTIPIGNLGASLEPYIAKGGASTGVAAKPAELLRENAANVRILLDIARKLDDNKKTYEITSKNAKAHYESQIGAQFLFIGGTDVDSIKHFSDDAEDDISAWPVRREKLGGIYVHNGFADHWEYLRSKVLDGLKGKEKTPLYVGGYSLGGAVATIAALDLKRQGYNIAYTVTLAAPDAGWKGFAKKYQEVGLNGKTVRFDDHDDVIPRSVPFGQPVGARVRLNTNASDLIPFAHHPLKNYLDATDKWFSGTEAAPPPPSSLRKFQFGGPIFGALHSQGGILAELEGGENVWSRRDVTRFGGQKGVETLKNLAHSIGVPESLKLPDLTPKFPFNSSQLIRPGVFNAITSRVPSYNHNVSVNMQAPLGAAPDAGRDLERIARDVFNRELQRSIESVQQNNPRIEG